MDFRVRRVLLAVACAVAVGAVVAAVPATSGQQQVAFRRPGAPPIIRD